MNEMSLISIGNIEIGSDRPPLVIPEIGINHGGDLEVAFAMADAAHEAGAKLIKHQTHVVEDEMSAHAKSVIPGNSAVSIYDVMASCALIEDEERELMSYTERKGMLFISTPFSRAAAERLEKFGVAAYKIGSGEMNNHPLIKHIAAFGKPMLISTGMNDMESIKRTVDIIDKFDTPFALMHTTNLYPTKPEFVRLGAMVEMMDAFQDVPVGLSDHTLNNNACIAATALGACLVERHFTDRKDRVGNDIICSMDGKELKDLIQAVEEVYRMRGGTKVPIPEERVTMDFAFASVVSIADIQAGDKFTHGNIWVKRPGTGGFSAEEFDTILGRRAETDIATGTQLRREMIR
jgi:sialic acid synthase SpsE